LFFGRLLRVVAGVAALAGALAVGLFSFWGIVLLFLGVSFLVGRLVGNPGCEVTALPNLALPKEKRLHCF
jgi:hypothetical protein